ncbi:hypothetical protein HF519_27530 [Pseudonocardia bannensis]|uniref:Uncharacterized protein n=1 Tax=Pseudonocardia bannensis TaxID=630973 RepID=A0A848DRW3_9PSEU|nr:hypothetical protein [Pseudonocardia bannensis]
MHDPATIVLDRTVTLGLGGDCLADIALLRAEPGVYGPVAWAPTVSRTLDRLAERATAALRAIAAAALRAIAAARAVARSRAWAGAGQHSPDHGVSADRRWSSTWTPPW